MKEEPANRCLRVDAIGQGLKMDMLVFHLINQIYNSNPSTLRPRRSRHALDYIEIYKRLASDSDDTAGDKVSVFRRTA